MRPGSAADVIEIVVEQAAVLRRAVLRNGDAAQSVAFAEDDVPGVFHLGVVASGGDVLATSTWIPNPCPVTPQRPAVQLRGMAVAREVQGSGIGGSVLDAGVARCAAAGVTLLWARARDSALAFYARHRWDVVGDGFVDATTGLPHHLVVHDLDTDAPG